MRFRKDFNYDINTVSLYFIIELAIYATMNLTCTVLFFRLAIQWPQLMAIWTAMEHPLLSAPYRTDGSWSLRSKLRVTAACLFAVTIGEYVLEGIQKGLSYKRRFEHCGWTLDEQVQRFFLFYNEYIFDRIPYSTIFVVFRTVYELI